MIKLIDLEPQFIRYETRIEEWQMVPEGTLRGDHAAWRAAGYPSETVKGPREYQVQVQTLAEAQGLWMLCPLCWQKNGGAVGTHGLEVPFHDRGVLNSQGMHNAQGKPVRWRVTGTGYADLSCTPSILLLSGCQWHGFITNGTVSII